MQICEYFIVYISCTSGNQQVSGQFWRDAYKKPKVVGIALGTKGRNPINLSKYKKDGGNHEQGHEGRVARGRQRKNTHREKREKKKET